MIGNQFRRRRFLLTVLLLLGLLVAAGGWAVLWRNLEILRVARALMATSPEAEWENVGVSQAGGGACLHVGPVTPGHWRGLAAAACGNWLGAEGAFQAVLEKQPADRQARFWLGVAHFRLGKTDQAVQEWAEAGAALRLLEAADRLAAAGNEPESLRLYRLVVRTAEASELGALTAEALGLAYYGLGENHRLRGEIAQAIPLFEQAVAQLPRSDIRYTLAVMLLGQGRHAEAIDLIQRNLEKEPDSATWLGALGEAYLQAGDLAQAEEALEHGLQAGRNPQDGYWHARAQFALSRIYAQRGAWEDVLAAAQDAVRLNGGIDPSWEYQFQVSFPAALQAQPDRLDWYLAIGDLYFSAGKLAEAQGYYRQAGERWPDDPEVRARLDR